VNAANSLLPRQRQDFNIIVIRSRMAVDLTGCIPFKIWPPHFSKRHSCITALGEICYRFSIIYKFLASYTGPMPSTIRRFAVAPVRHRMTTFPVPSAQTHVSRAPRFCLQRRLTRDRQSWRQRFCQQAVQCWSLSPIRRCGLPGRPVTSSLKPIRLPVSSAGARPNVVPSGTALQPLAEIPRFLEVFPTAFLQGSLFLSTADWRAPLLDAGRRPGPLQRPSACRTFSLGEPLQLEGIIDLFNIANRYTLPDLTRSTERRSHGGLRTQGIPVRVAFEW